jgi:hypothetical protein
VGGSSGGRLTLVRFAAAALRALAILLALGFAAWSSPAVARAETGVVTDGGVRLRAGPWGTVVGAVGDGARVQVNARISDAWDARWYYVTTGSGGLGWVHADFVTLTSAPRARVGLQVGHWRYLEADYPLNRDSGSILDGATEIETNLGIALALSRRLSARGIAVDLLPTVIPSGYRADAVVAIHSDAGPSHVRGFFVDRPRRSPVVQREAALANGLKQGMIRLTGIPYVLRSTEDSRDYYGFRAVDAMTPIVLIETGCLTNAADRAIIAGQPGLVADALAGPISDLVLR